MYLLNNKKLLYHSQIIVQIYVFFFIHAQEIIKKVAFLLKNPFLHDFFYDFGHVFGDKTEFLVKN